MNTNLEKIEASATLALSAKAKELESQGKKVLNLAAGEPDTNTPKHIIDAAKRAMDEGKTKYTPAAGIIELRDALAKRYSCSREEVIVSNGGKQAIYNALLALLNPEDKVYIQRPYWVSYPAMVHLCGGTPVFIDEITDTIDKGVLIINSPNNPAGTVIDDAEQERIAKIVKEKECFVISDEVYEAFEYGSNHTSIRDLVPERTILIGSCSKEYAMTGWRIGWAIAPAHIVKAMTKAQSHMTSAPNTIAQYAALAAITGPQDCVKELHDRFARRRELIRKAELPAMQLQGAFYAFIDVSSTGLSSEEFCNRMIEKGLVLVPGSAFGMDSHVRLSYAVDDSVLQEALTILKEALS